MLNQQGIPPRKQESSPIDAIEQLNLEHSFQTQPPQRGLQGFGGQDQAPYSAGVGYNPTPIIDTIPATGHTPTAKAIKATIRPVSAATGSTAVYRTEVKPTASNPVGYVHDGHSTVHLVQDDTPRQTLHAGPNMMSPNGIPLIVTNTAGEPQQMSVMHPEVNAVIHAYNAAKEQDVGVVATGLIEGRHNLPTEEEELQEIILDTPAVEHSRTIPRHRNMYQRHPEPQTDAKHDEDLPQFAQGLRARERDIKLRNKTQLTGATSHMMEDVYARSYSAIPEATGATGFSRGVSGLVRETDLEKQSVYNFIVRDLASHDQRMAIQEALKAENASSIQERLSEFAGVKTLKELSDNLLHREEQEQFSKLTLQDSAKLGEFLDSDKRRGLLWEENDGDSEDSDSPIKPRVVYAGVSHEPPQYAGKLKSVTMVLHACEFHQYVAISGKQTPPFMGIANPHTDAIHGPVPLPHDPEYTGMPAPIFDEIRRDPTNLIRISPMVGSWFDNDLPVTDIDLTA